MILSVASSLIETLNKEAIPYCHWAGNQTLAEALAGEKDLDLLVDRRAADQVRQILAGHGYKLAGLRWEAETPGVFHYYGFDSPTSQFSHLHLYYIIFVGESFVPSHRLPFERMLLEHSCRAENSRPITTSKAAELLVFVIDRFLQYGSPLDLSYRLRKLGEDQAEIQWLQQEGNLNETLSLLNQTGVNIEPAFFGHCLQALVQPAPLRTRLTLAWRLRRRLSAFARHSVVGWLWAYLCLLSRYGWHRLHGSTRSKIPHNGGLVIAFVGPEATGKSTLVTSCGDWLGQVFAVEKIHAGKPPPTWLTKPLHLALPLLRRRLPDLRTTRFKHVEVASTTKPKRPGTASWGTLIHAIRAVMVGWDRRQLLIKVRRLAANGTIVFCDRYPSETIEAMDSPRLRKLPQPRGLRASLYNRLAALEEKFYAQIPPPDLVFRLHVPLEVAIKRNRTRFKIDKESDDYVRLRHQQSQAWCRSGTNLLHDIDTGRSRSRTIAQVKQFIWEAL